MTGEDAKEYIETLRRHFAEKLTEWKEGFLAGLELQLERGGSLSPKQEGVLDGLMERVAKGYGR